MVNQPVPGQFNSLPPQKKHTSLIVAVVMTVLFIAALAFGMWAYVGMVDNQTDLDAKIETASQVAVQKAEADKEAEFAEREKVPFKTYTGSSTYGSLTFEYPKSWSVYVETSDGKTPLDFYAHPDVIPGFDETNFAFRAQIIDSDYQNELDSFDSKVKNGSVTVTAFRPEKVPNELGAVIEGEISKDVQGTLILLPQRDKTFRLFTESEDYQSDFAKIIKSVTFVP